MKQPITLIDQKETAWGYLILFIELLVLPTAVDILKDLFRITMSAPLQNFTCFALNFLLVITVFYRFWFRCLKDLNGKSLSLLSVAAVYLGLYYLLTYLVNILVYTAAPDYFNANDANIAVMTNEARLLMSVSVVVLVPPAEEFLFRGVIFGSLYRQSPWMAYTVSITAFAAVHILGYIGIVPPVRLLLSFVQYLPAGFCLSRAYARSGSIFAPILIHCLINFIGILSI